MFENKDKCVLCGKSNNIMIGTTNKNRRVCIDCLNQMNDNLAKMKKELKPLVAALQKGAEAFRDEYEKQKED